MTRNTARCGPSPPPGWTSITTGCSICSSSITCSGSTTPSRSAPIRGVPTICHPRFYKGQPNQLFLNKGDGTFEDVSAKWGIRSHVSRGMGVGVADYDLDGRPDLFVPNDAFYNSLFHNLGDKFEEVAFPAGVALPEDGSFVSGMGVDFRDFNNDGYPDIDVHRPEQPDFPPSLKTAARVISRGHVPQRDARAQPAHGGLRRRLYDFDNDGWKDLFVARGHVASLPQPGVEIDQPNTVFRNTGQSGKWIALTEEAGLTARPPARHRGCAFGDLDGDGRIDVVVTALGGDAEIWMNRSEGAGHWLDIALEGTKSNRDGIGARIKVVTKTGGAQYNHMTTSVGYASSSAGPVHFGLGSDTAATQIDIQWPSGASQTLRNVAGDRVLQVKEPDAR